MSENVLNWGLLSTARINRALIPAIGASPRSRLVAVASRQPDRAEAYAAKWKIERAYGSYDQLLEDPAIDVIYNSLPNHLHAEWSIRAMRAGKHVLCEKPMALSAAELGAMAAASKETGKVLAEAFMYRHHPQTLRVKEIVDSGRLGRIQLIKGAFTFTLRREGDIRLGKETGGGSIWDVGCYPISYAIMVAGESPKEVFGWQKLGDGGADVTFVGQMKFFDGLYGQFDAGFASPPRSYMEIVGSEGVLNIPVPFKPGVAEVLQLTKEDRLQDIPIKGQELYLGEVEDMADAILQGKPPRVSLADSRAIVVTIRGLLESAETGRPIDISRA